MLLRPATGKEMVAVGPPERIGLPDWSVPCTTLPATDACRLLPLTSCQSPPATAEAAEYLANSEDCVGATDGGKEAGGREGSRVGFAEGRRLGSAEGRSEGD